MGTILLQLDFITFQLRTQFIVMGLTKTTNSPGLSFDFNHPRAQYSPGDVISGHVVLNTAADAAIGTVTVSFWGRAKSRIIQQHGQSASYHRGRTRFFHLEKVLYEGQYTHKPGSFSWPFDFVVPNQADQGCILPGGSSSSEKWKPKEHYRSNLDENKNNNELDLNLPPSMSHSRMNMGRKADCFIEYVLEATLTEPRGIHQFRGPKTKTSTYPIIFNPLSTPEPIQNYDLVTEERLFTISTLKLLPEHAGTSLGIRDPALSSRRTPSPDSPSLSRSRPPALSSCSTQNPYPSSSPSNQTFVPRTPPSTPPRPFPKWSYAPSKSN